MTIVICMYVKIVKDILHCKFEVLKISLKCIAKRRVSLGLGLGVFKKGMMKIPA